MCASFEKGSLVSKQMAKRFQKVTAFLITLVFTFSQIAFPQQSVPIEFDSAKKPTVGISQTSPIETSGNSFPQTSIDFLQGSSSPLTAVTKSTVTNSNVISTVKPETIQKTTSLILNSNQTQQISILSYKDGPDPFSRVRGSNDLTITFNVKRFKEQKGVTFFIDVLELIQDSSGKIVNLVTKSTQIIQPPFNGSDFFQVTTINSWRGTDPFGKVVSDGTYSYTAVGVLRKVTQQGTVTKESIQAISSLIAGKISVDNTAPLITAVQSPEPNASNWNNTNVNVSFNATDSSGIANKTADILVTTEGVNQKITGTATDNAGNATSVSVFLNIDKTAPTLSAILGTPPNANGWHNTDVTVSFQASDALSGIASVTPDILVATEGANQMVTGTATDLADNVASVKATLNIDKTPPSIQAILSSPPNANGWHNQDVTVSFQASDALSGIASVTPDVLVNTETAGQLVNGTATDLADNVSNTQVTIKLDKTPPVVSNLLPADHNTVNESRPTITADLSDPLSGIDPSKVRLLVDDNEVTNNATITQTSISFTPLSDLAEGSHTVKVQLEDLAGNVTTVERTFTVETVAPPPVTPLSGFIDGTVFNAVSKEPILGAKVTIAGINGAVATEANGSFSIATPDAGSFIVTIEHDGFTSVQRIAHVESNLDIAVDPIFLTPLDSAVTRIDSSGGTHVSSTGDVMLVFPPGAVTEPINVRATKFQAGNHLPGPLPEQSHFTYAVNFQPNGTQFQVPVTYRIRNDLGFAPGTPIPVGIYNEGTASWDALSMSYVTADGQWVEGVLSHFTSIDCNLPVFISRASVSPVIPIADLLQTETKDKRNSVKCPGCEIDMFDGALRQEITIPSVSLFGQDQAVTLRYDSSQAYPTVLIGSASQVPSAIQLTPTTISAAFEFQGQRTEATFSGALTEVMLRQLFAAQNARGGFLETGLYSYHYTPSNDYSLKYATADFFGGPPRQELSVVSPELVSFTAPITGKVPVVNERESAFGAGWSMEGLERIYEQRDGTLLLTDGTGSAFSFSQAYRAVGLTTNYEVDPAAAFPGGTTVGNSTTRIAFDPSGNLYIAEDGITKIAPNGTKTQFHPAFTDPRAITTDSNGNVYIAERHRVWKYVPDGSSRELVYESANPLGSILDLKVDSSGNLYIADTDRLFKRTPGGQVTELFQLNGLVSSVAVDSLGNVFATESTYQAGVVGNEPQTIGQPRIVMRKPDGFLSTYAVGFQDPEGLVIDPDGNLIVADQGLSQILKVTSDHQVEPIVKGGNGVAGSAWTSNFVEVAYNPSGKLFTLNGFFVPGRGPAHVVSEVIPTTKYFPPPGEFSEVSKNSDGTFARRMKDGTVKHFNVEGFLTDVLDRNGNRNSYHYDSLGRLIDIEDPVGRKTLFSYGANGKLASITDVAGSVTYFQIDVAGNLLNVQFSDLATRSFSYDSEYRMTQETDPASYVTNFNYDSLGLLSEEILPEMLVYDPNTGEPVLKSSHRIFHAENSSGLASQIPAGTGTPENPAPRIQRADVSGSYTDASGQVTTFQSNRLGAPTEVRDALGQTTSIIRNLDGLPTEIRQSNGLVTTYQYDGLGNPTRVRTMTIPGFFEGTDTFYFYEPVFNQVIGIWSSLRRETAFHYDALGNLIKISDPVGDFGPNQTDFSYNSRGLVTEVKDAFGNKTLSSYDLLGNLLTVTDPLMNVTQMTYDLHGNVISSLDPLGRTTLFKYDSMNRLIQVTDSNQKVTRYHYDTRGNLAEVEDSEGRKTQYQYDALKRLVKIIFPDLKENLFGYDERGNVVRSVDRKGQITTYFYDELNRLVEKRTPDNTTFYGYDSVGNLTQVEDNDSLLRFEYDPLSRLVKAQTGDATNPALTQPVTTITYEYDLDSHRTKMTSPLGQTLYNYVETFPPFGSQKNRGNLVSLTDPFGQVFTFTYDTLGRRTSYTRPNQTKTTYQYSSRNELTSINDVNTQTASSIQSFVYTYDDTGNRLTTTDAQGLHQYQYDHLNQLTGVSGSTPESYQYDSLGNRVSSQLSTTYKYDSLTNQLLEDDTFTYSYDANGNLQTKTNKSNNQTTTYTYDADNQLIKITFPNSSFVTYSYDGLGRRIEKNVSGVMTRYVYDGGDILMEYNSVNQLTAYYIHGPGIDEPLSVARDLNHNSTFESNEHFFYHTDALGSVTAITDNTGNLVESYQYDSFGNPTIYNSTNTVIPESLIGNSYLFTGREYDSESGLYYYRHRYYDPKVGRFISEDPIAGNLTRPQSLNLYPYVENDPENSVDPFGLRSLSAKVKTVLSGAEAVVSVVNSFSYPLGTIVAAVSILNFVHSTNDAGYDTSLGTANVLVGAISILFGAPIIGVVASPSVGFGLGEIISTLRIPGTANSTFGDIYADFFNNPSAIQLTSSFINEISSFCAAGFIAFGAS